MNEAPAIQPRRPYRQTARAEAVEATARRIAQAFWDCMSEGWYDEITLEELAKRAGVTVRTILRRFGGKEGLAARFIEYVAPDVRKMRASKPGDVAAAVGRVIDLYEATGDSFIRHLAQEARQPALRPLLDGGRREHRAITAAAYAPWLHRLDKREQCRTLDALVIATDVYTWKLLRRDMGRSAKETKATMLALVQAILDRCLASQQERDNK